MRQQMNVPIRPKNSEQVQTNVNLISPRGSQIVQSQVSAHSGMLSFVNDSLVSPFSDYYLLGQLNTVIQELRKNIKTGEEYQTRQVVDELAGQIHGLLARELRVQGQTKGYYDILLEKEREITKLQIKYGNIDRRVEEYLHRIQQLEREIVNLREQNKLYQSAAQENQLYKTLFRQLKESTSKKVSDTDKLLTEQILPKIKDFQKNLSEISKNAGKDRASKQKAAISRYAQQLDALSKQKNLDWQTLSNSAAVFFSSLQHLNDDDWIQQRLNLASSYNELKTRHSALLGLVNKNVQQLLQKDTAFKNVTQIAQLIQILQNNSSQIETSIVNGWIGLGTIHGHRYSSSSSSLQQSKHLASLVSLFQVQFRRLSQKFPQLHASLSSELQQFLSLQISRELIEGDPIEWIRQILVKETQVIYVDNVYNYYSKTDKQNLYYLRVCVKALLQQLKRISTQNKINIELDEGILQLLKAQILDNVNIDDIIALFRPGAKFCQVEVVIDKPNYLPITQTVGVPLRQEKAVIVSDTAHFAVNLQQGVPYRKQIPYQYHKTDVQQVPYKIQIPYAVQTKLVEEVVRYDQKVQLIKVPVVQQKPIQVIRDHVVDAREQLLVSEQVVREVQVPYHTRQVEYRDIQVQKQVPKNVYKQISKIFKVEQVVPKVYKEPKFQIVQKPVHHVVVQKQIQFVEVERPIVQKLQVAKVIQVMVQKPIQFTDHCDCQKPEAVTVQIQKPIYKQIPKQIIVQKCHFVQPNTQQKIVQVAVHSQVPIFKQVIKQVPVFVDKPVPLRTVQQKLVVVDRQIPFFIEHFTPVQLIVEKPVIVKDIKHVPVEVEQPVPVYIDRIVPKIVQVFRDRIVQKIVQVPRVQIVQKIVQKIVTIPRIIQKIVTVTQIVQVPVFIQTPVLEIIHVPVQKLATDLQQKQKIIQVTKQVLRIEKQLQVVNRVEYEQITKLTEIQPQSYPQIIRQKAVGIIQQKPVQIFTDRLVDRVIHIRDVIPVEQRVQIPIQIQVPVQIITNKPIFYKQPVVQIDVQRVDREVVVELVKETVRVQRVQVPVLKKQKQIVEIPGETIVIRESELHIVQVERQNVVTANDVEERPVNHYIDIQKAHIIQQPTFVIPQKQVAFLEKPYGVSIQKPVKMRHEQMVVVERPQTLVVKAREGINQQIVKVVTQQVLSIQKQSYPEPIVIPEHHNHILYEELPPKTVERSVMVVDQKVRASEVVSTVEIQDTNKQIITRQIQVPIYMQKLIEKIIMLPQIVEVQKRVYMVQQINTLLAKQVSLQTHYQEYRGVVSQIQDSVNQLLKLINTNRQINTADLKKRLNIFLQLLRTESRIPKVVETVREVEVIKQRDRPVLVPVYDSAREKVLHVIIADLVEGIKGLNKADIEKRFSERIRNLFSYDFGIGETSSIQSLQQFQQNKVEVQGKWKSWLDNYDKNLPNVQPEQILTEAQGQFILGYDSKEQDYAVLRASLQKLSLIHKQRLHEVEKLKLEYGNTINQLRSRLAVFETELSTQKYYKDLYLKEFLKIKQLLEERQYDQIIIILERITKIRQQAISSNISQSGQTVHIEQRAESQDNQLRISQLISQLTVLQNQTSVQDRQILTLRQENQRLRTQIQDIRLNIPVWNRDAGNDDNLRRFNQEWEQRLKGVEQNHFLELNYLREKLMQRLSGSGQGNGNNNGNEEFTRAYNDLVAKYTVLVENQKNVDSERKNIERNYEERIRELTKQLNNIKRDNENTVKRNEQDRKKVIDDYERRLTSTSSAAERELRKQLENLGRNYESLQRNSENEKKRLVEDYQRRLTTSQGTQGNQERELRRQLDDAKRNIDNSEKRFQVERKKLIDEYESKLAQKVRDSENSERRLKQLQEQLERAKSSSSKRGASSEQNQQLTILRQKIRQLQQKLENSKREVEIKSKLKETSYTSGLKQSAFEGQFQSPQVRYKSGGIKYQVGERQQAQQGSQVQTRRISRSGVRTSGRQYKQQQSVQEVRSQSSRSASESGAIKKTMTLQEFINERIGQNNDSINTIIMIKIIEKMEQQINKGIINSYTPRNIYLSNLNLDNLDALLVRFGAPITNRTNPADAVYLSPEVLRGENASPESIVFTLGVIWDELLHLSKYFSTVQELQSLTFEFKVRNTNIDPILRNTLFEMMSKNPSQRILLKEARRRLSLQKYILLESPGGRITTSRVTIQSRKQ